MAKRGALPDVDVLSEKNERNEKFQNILNAVKRKDGISRYSMKNSNKKPKHEELAHDTPVSRSGLGAMDRLLGNLFSFGFNDIDTLSIQGFISGNHSGIATLNTASVARLSSCLKKKPQRNFLTTN